LQVGKILFGIRLDQFPPHGLLVRELILRFCGFGLNHFAGKRTRILVQGKVFGFAQPQWLGENCGFEIFRVGIF
jgi:hypothetical protein